MTEKNIALSLALEAEAEADAVANTYEGLAQVLDIENCLTDAKQAEDVAVGLENLSLVLESLKELDATDIALVQVIGDIAGASSGISGAVFTPALESSAVMNVEQVSTSDKSQAIIDKIKQMIAYVVEKIKAFIAWAIEKFRNGFKHLKETVSAFKHMVGRSADSRKINSIRKRCASMLELSKAIEQYVPIVADLAETRIAANEAEAGHVEETMDVSVLNKMEAAQRQLLNFEKKFDEKTWHAGVKIGVQTERINHTNTLSSTASFCKNYFVVTQSLIGGGDEPSEENTSKISHDLVSEIEDVVSDYARFLGESGALSLTTLSKSLEQEMKNFKDHLRRHDNDIDLKLTGRKTYGPMKASQMREILGGIIKDITSITKLSSAIDSECTSLNKALARIRDVEEQSINAKLA